MRTGSMQADTATAIDSARLAPPTIEISGEGSLFELNLGGLWASRDWLYFWAWRNIKIRYRHTVLGAAWAVMQPLLTMLLASVLFARLPGADAGGVPYPLFVFCGLLPWTFVNTAINASTNSLI